MSRTSPATCTRSRHHRGNDDRPTARSELIVNSPEDPATLQHGAAGVHRTLPGSRLITVQGAFGHGVVGSNAYAQECVVTYLNTGELPASNLTCETTTPLFP